MVSKLFFCVVAVKILLLILLVALICVGVYFIARAFDTDDNEAGSVEVIPNLDNGTWISYKAGDRESVRSVVRKIEDTLKRKMKIWKFR